MTAVWKRLAYYERTSRHRRRFVNLDNDKKTVDKMNCFFPPSSLSKVCVGVVVFL